MFVMDSQTLVKTLISNFKDASLSSSLRPKPQENGTVFTSDESQISIFDAHKYFSESSNDLLSVPRLSPLSSIDGYCRNFFMKSFRSTPTPSSETSCNSRTGLLLNPQRSAQNTSKNLPLDCINKRWRSAKKWLLIRKKCCCRGEKAVQVKESTSDTDHGKPVVLINAKNTRSVCRERKQRKQRKQGKQGKQGKQSSPASASEKIVEIHHIKAMEEVEFSPADAPRLQRITAPGRTFVDGAVGFTFPIPNLSNPVISSFNEDDGASDASSDLFEIDSLSVQTASCPMHCGRNSVGGDDGGGAALRLPEVGGEGRMQGSLMRCRKEEEVSMKCVAEGPPILPLQVGGGPPVPPSFGGCQGGGRLSAAFAACECGVSQANLW